MPKASTSKKVPIFIAFLGGFLWLVYTALHPPLPSKETPLIFYSNQLRDDLKRVVISAILSAKESISLQIYGLTDPDVTHALQKATLRGVTVSVFFDPKGSKGLPFGTPVKAGGLMHRKILVVDQTKTFVGSANFTPSSLKLHDNLLVGLYGREIASHFSDCIESSATFAHGLTAFFLPDFEGKAMEALCQKLNGATQSIDLAMFTLTHPTLIDCLKKAVKRGVKVQVALDAYTGKGSSQKALLQLKEAGAILYTSFGNQLLHHKWALIDKTTLAMGSANWTRAAFSKNQDCLLIFDSLSEQNQKKLHKLWQAIANTCEKL